MKDTNCPHEAYTVVYGAKRCAELDCLKYLGEASEAETLATAEKPVTTVATFDIVERIKGRFRYELRDPVIRTETVEDMTLLLDSHDEQKRKLDAVSKFIQDHWLHDTEKVLETDLHGATVDSTDMAVHELLVELKAIMEGASHDRVP